VILLALLCVAAPAATPETEVLAALLRNAEAQALSSVARAPELVPQYFVYGLELEASVGVGDVIEKGAALGLELHYERVDP